MKFSTTTGKLLAALDTARSATPAAPSLTAYAGVSILTHTDFVSVTGADGDVAIERTASAHIEVPGGVLLAPGPIVGLLRTVSSDTPVTIELHGDLSVSIDGLKPYALRPIHATFPPVTAIATEEVPVSFQNLQAAVAAVRHACGKEIGGVQLVSNDTGVHLRATDSYRLHAVQFSTSSFGSFSGVVPLQVLSRIAESDPTHVTIDGHARLLSTRSSTTTITTRLLGVPFPPVDALLTTAMAHSAQLPLAPARTALQRLTAVADHARVEVVIKDGTAVFSAENFEVGTGAEEFACESSAEITFTAASNFLADALAAHTAPVVALGWNAPNQPITLSATAPFPVRCLVMPIAR